MKNYDFVIVGGGIAGLSLGYELSASSRLLVLEQEDAPGYHTTGRSAAIYSELMLEPTLLSLAVESKRFFIDPPNLFAQTPLVKTCGCLFVGGSKDKQNIEAACQRMNDLGVECQVIDGDDIAKRVPVARQHADAVFCGLFEPNAMRIDVDQLMQSYVKGITARGGVIAKKAAVLALEKSANQWVITTSKGPFSASTLINAAGAWGDRIAELAGVAPMGLDPRRRTMITFDAPQDYDITSWPPLGDFNGSYYYMPDAGQLAGSLSDETPSPPCDAQPEEIDIATAAYTIEQNTHLEIKKINHSWAGLRTFAPDRLPVIGPDPEDKHFFWCVGQGGSGIETAPALSKLAARIALNDEAEAMAAGIGVDLELLSPARFR
ncbi:FAD dependent oxidoreductase [Luminiphilus syltensis NOR5-1B]|uniref:FAD dependent oxidoreductase n=1 Tax=Luminiphilus syltensis NOR5-1B TaxID=565045 RepID=B8KX79_9GAMM|nr:FAD-binding oxidoreductase [Luminiphilus syltensis]EED34794.1 FAD dependent oxidoreductase [Luminiphilus syltensis NOR5-1B]